MTFFGPDIRNGLPIGLGSMAGFGRRAFTPSVLFAAGEQGFWYDPTDIPVNWRRNLLTYTEQFDNAAWLKSDATVVADSEIAPNGAPAAGSLVENTATAAHSTYRSAGTLTGVYTASCYVKAAGRSWCYMEPLGNAATRTFFNLSGNGALGTTGTGVTASILAVGNGWYRITTTYIYAAQTGFVTIGAASANATPSYSGNGLTALYIWGAQLEVGSTATDYQRIVTPEISFLDYQPQPVMYTDSAGTTPVTAVEQAVGLILDKSKGLVLGPELVTNGDFSNGTTGWGTFAGSIAVSGGEATLTANPGAAFPQITQTVSGLTVGRTYLMTGTARRGTTVDNAFISPVSGTSVQTSSTSATALRITFVAAATSVAIGLGIFSGSTNGTAVFDNISVRELAGNHAIQPGATNRPILRSRYNLLTYSEQFDNAAWDNKTNSSITQNAAVAPDGTTTADKLVENTVSGTHNVNQAFSYVNQAYVFSAYVSKASERNAMVYMYTASGFAGALLNVANGTASVFSGSVAGTVATAVEVGSYWRVSVTALMPAGAGSANIYAINGTSASYLGDGTSGILIWGADLRRSSDTYLPYQRIAAATDYDVVGFPPYLAFDGSDDSLYTGGNVDFSATDKITLWAGVTKLSDGALGAVAEISADSTANNGAFWLLAPYTAGVNHYSSLSRGTANAIAVSAAAADAAPDTAVLSARMDISAPINELRVDSVIAQTQTATQGTGNYGSYPLYIGRRNNATLPFNGRLYQLIGRGAATSAALITQAERWVAGKQGRSL